MKKEYADKIAEYVKDNIDLAYGYEFNEETGCMKMILFSALDEFDGRDAARWAETQYKFFVKRVGRIFGVSAKIKLSRQQDCMNVVTMIAE